MLLWGRVGANNLRKGQNDCRSKEGEKERASIYLKPQKMKAAVEPPVDRSTDATKGKEHRNPT